VELKVFRARDTVRATHCQDGAIILAIHTGKVLRLNATGSLVFKHLQQGATEVELITAVCTNCGVSTGVAAADVHEFLQALEQLALISSSPSHTESAEGSTDAASSKAPGPAREEEQLR
jgi:coenzyme PQQ synthesis protein D (PqqD)